MPEALQVVEERGVRLDALDLRELGDDERAARLDALWGEPDDGQLPAATLVRTGDAEHLVFLRVHGLSADDASFETLARELAALYAAERGGEGPGDEPVPYLAVAEWLNEIGSSEEAEAGRAFWLERSRLPAAEPPLERDAPGEAATARRPLPAALAEVAAALAQELGAPAETVVLAAWAALLHRLGGPAALRLEVAFDGRTDEELKTAVGPFTQYLPLAAEVDAEAPFRALAGRLRDARDEAAGWQEVYDAEALHRLLDDSAAPRLGFSALAAPGTHAGGGVSVSLVRRAALAEPFALHLLVEGDGDATTLELRGDGFSPARLARMLERVEALLADALARPDAPVSALAVTSEAERHALLRGWNATAREIAFAPVHAAFAAQAARTPDAVAVRGDGRDLTYAELERDANRLANRLRALGVGLETRVGVCLERSAGLVTALLGVLKAGGAYIPLDPSYPGERLAYMLEDAKAAVLVTAEKHLSLFPGFAGTAVCLDGDGDAIAAESSEAPAVEVPGDALAYVLYTSGSTGRPKGVAVSHAALANHMAWMQRAWPLATDDRVLQKTPISFDASVWEFWAPLLAGATLVAGGADTHRDPAELARAVRDEGVTVLQLVPSLLRAVLDDGALAETGTRWSNRPPDEDVASFAVRHPPEL